MKPNLIRDLGDGLVLRRSTVDDAEKLANFQAEIQYQPDAQGSDVYVGAWTRDLLTRPHPTFDPGDFTLVEDTRTGAIVSSLCLISQTWTYEGIPFGVGQPELVSTHPDYRRRGLVRAQFEVLHEWSAQRGQMVQAVAGIPWYYRQFGYEMAMTLGGNRTGYRPHLPKLKEGEQEPYCVRPAVEQDLAFIADLYEQGARRYPVACTRDEALWRYELSGMSTLNVERHVLGIVETAQGEPVGFLAHANHLERNSLWLDCYELRSDVSWLAVSPSVVRYLWAQGDELAAQGVATNPNPEMERLSFGLGVEHPAYEVLQARLPEVRPPYAWYLRVPDLVGFLQHIAPALERRLAESPLVGHTGELKLSFYRSGLLLAFEQGRLARIEPVQPLSNDWGNAAFPDQTFLQILFGYRSLQELRASFADCWASGDEPRALLEALFPKCASRVWSVG